MRAVNLLPPDMRGASKATAELGARPEATGGAGAFIVLGVLAACVAGVAGYVLTTNTIKQRQAELAAVTARQQALQGQVAALKPFADFDATTNSRVQTVKDLAGSRFDWEQVLRDVSRAIPADVSLKTIDGNVSTGTGGGSGGSIRAAITAPALSLTGCAPGQTQVARLMARLRNVDGVTRVSLSKSDIQTVAADQTGSGTALARRNAAPCGTGARPAFELVMFFEKATAAVQAPSAQPPAAGQAGATATPTPAAGAGATATATATATPDNTTTASTGSSAGSTP